jgi:protein-tyrosine phosphatase
LTLFHCAAGKDRTGLVAALMLALAGVPDDVIDADYAVSSELLAPRIAELRAEAIHNGEDMALFERRAACLPESMQEVLDGLRTQYGGAEGYLRHINLTDEEIGALKLRLVE